MEACGSRGEEKSGNETQKPSSPEEAEEGESSLSSPRGVTQGRCLPPVCGGAGGALLQTLKGYPARPGRMRGYKQTGLGVTRGPWRGREGNLPRMPRAGSRGPRHGCPRPRPVPYPRLAAEDEVAAHGCSSQPGAPALGGGRVPADSHSGRGCEVRGLSSQGPGVRGPRAAGSARAPEPAQRKGQGAPREPPEAAAAGGIAGSQVRPHPAPLPPRELWRRSSTVSADWPAG